jgi:hypothetical protein
MRWGLVRSGSEDARPPINLRVEICDEGRETEHLPCGSIHPAVFRLRRVEACRQDTTTLQRPSQGRVAPSSYQLWLDPTPVDAIELLPKIEAVAADLLEA